MSQNSCTSYQYGSSRNSEDLVNNIELGVLLRNNLEIPHLATSAEAIVTKLLVKMMSRLLTILYLPMTKFSLPLKITSKMNTIIVVL